MSGQGFLNVLNYGAKCDGVTDDSTAFNEAIEDGAKESAPVIVPKRTCKITKPIVIKSGTMIEARGATLLHGVGQGPLLTAVSVDDWVLEGPLTLVGTRKGANEEGDETGLLISGANRFIVDKLTVRDFKGTGIELSGGKPSRAARGDRGKLAFISAINNHLGMAILDGKKYSAEYNLFTMMSFSGNDTALKVVAGNNIISSANFVDNGNGILLTDGLNHGHGIVSAVNINHNRGFNVKAERVTKGYTFNGCHIYGDSETAGTVTLEESKDINLFGCVVYPARQ